MVRTNLGADMKNIGILPLAIFLVATCANGQGSSKKDTSVRVTLAGAHCPVSLQATHGDFFMERRAGSFGFNPAPDALQQRIHLTMTNPQPRDIVSAQVTAHGLSDKWRIVGLSTSTPAPDLAKTIDLAFDVKGKGQGSGDLSLKRFTAVTSIDLDSIEYADGSSWHAAWSGACSIKPSALMPVSSVR